jgi:hypothetical protein
MVGGLLPASVNFLTLGLRRMAALALLVLARPSLGGRAGANLRKTHQEIFQDVFAISANQRVPRHSNSGTRARTRARVSKVSWEMGSQL